MPVPSLGLPGHSGSPCDDMRPGDSTGKATCQELKGGAAVLKLVRVVKWTFPIT